MAGEAVKRSSSLRILEQLKLKANNTPRHLIFHARKKPKNNPASQRDYNKMVFKSFEQNPEFSDSPPSKNGPKLLYIDAVIHEYVNFMTNERRKSRVVIEGNAVVGKLSTFVPNLKNFSTLNIDDDDFMYDFASKMRKGLKGSKLTSITSFAQALVLVQRLGIYDMHLNNFGYDETGRVVMFDFEDAMYFSKKPDGQGFSEDNFKDITEQPNDCTFGDAVDPDEVDIHDDFVEAFEEDYALFQRAVNRAILKEIVCPTRLFAAIVNHAETGVYPTASKWIVNKLLVTQNELTEILLRGDDFQDYLQTHGDNDMVNIVAEFEQATQYHRRYFPGDERKIFLQEVQNHYNYIKERFGVENAERQIPFCLMS